MKILKILLQENTQIEIKIALKAIELLSTLTWCFCMIQKGEELRLMLIIHVIRNDSANIILLYNAHDRVFFDMSPLGSAYILKFLVK